MSKLHNIRGRIYYISSDRKQENLYAVYETTDHHYWTELARFNQQEFQKSGTEGKCIEAREFIIALPESFPDLYYPDKLLQHFTDRFKEKYGVECIAALHHNKRRTNYHIHLIFSERELLEEPIEKAAPRNMFYDEKGKRCRTKKEVLDEKGNLRKGCKIVKKGEVYERISFTKKNPLFKQESFVDEVKHFYTNLINTLIEDDKEKLHVFEKNGLYLATKKIGKNNPKAELIQHDNEVRMKWNMEVDRAIIGEVPEAEILQIKQEYITDRIKESIDIFGSLPERLGKIIMTAIAALAMLVSKALKKEGELSAKIFDTKTVQPPLSKQGESVGREQANNALVTNRKTEYKAQTAENEMLQIPQKPIMPAEAAKYPKLSKIYKELNRQNNIIFDAERERNALELECDSLKGFTKLTGKRDLQSKIERKNEEIDILKFGLSGIVKRYGYRTVQDFYGAFRTAEEAWLNHRNTMKEWEKACGVETQSGAETLEERLKKYEKETADCPTRRLEHGRDRGAR